MYEEKLILIPYDLQFFAKDGEGGEKTEEPTSKKLKDARNDGKVARSKELTAGFSLVAFFLCLKIFTGFLGTNFKEIFFWIYEAIPDIVHDNGRGLTIPAICGIFQQVILKMLLIMLPFLLIGFAVAFVGSLVQVGWNISTKPMEPKLSKFNPINGFKRIFSKESIFNLIKSLVKLVLIFYIAYTSIKDQAGSLFILYEIGLNQAIAFMGDLIINVGLKISILYVVVGFIDYFFEKRKFKEDMKMTKQEVKDEYKNTEGDPAVKSAIRSKMMQASRARMMKDVPKADVVITNPTHIAVAIRYDREQDTAPKVLAKGQDLVAQRIKEIAKESRVPVMENKPLARALYATVDIGGEVPPELYQAVAEILAVVYTNRAS